MPAKFTKFFSDPLSIVLVVVIVVALVFAGLLGAELYARNRADTVVAAVVECVVQDDATVSFGVLPPFLCSTSTGHYSNIHITTAGNQVRDAKGMKANLDIDDVRLHGRPPPPAARSAPWSPTSTWTSDGIKQTIQDGDSADRQLRQRRDHQRRPTAPSNSTARSAASSPSRRWSTTSITLQVQS